MAQVQIHFDGDITSNHQVSMRTLGKTLTHLQNAMDRAFLEKKFGALWKHAKMRSEYYKHVELLTQQPKEGGYIFPFLNADEAMLIIIDRVSSAINSAIEQSKNNGLKKSSTIQNAIAQRRIQIEKGIIEPKDFRSVYDNPDPKITRQYADRAIVREIDDILAIIRSKEAGDSSMELSLYGKGSSKFDFNREKATSFHTAISKRDLGMPLIYQAIINSMSRKNKNGKILNIVTKKESNIYFHDEESFQQVMPFFDKNVEIKFIGSPFIEYGAFDPEAGDIYFIGLY